MTGKLQKAERKGRWAEILAAISLQLQILARRARTPSGEIDLIARRKSLIAFVEVKARRTHTLAVESVTPTAQRRITRAAELWMAHRRDLDGHDWRFDIITVTPRRWPKHHPDAFRPDPR